MVKTSKTAGMSRKLGSGTALLLFIVSAFSGVFLLASPSTASSTYKQATTHQQSVSSSNSLIPATAAELSNAAGTAWSTLTNGFGDAINTMKSMASNLTQTYNIASGSIPTVTLVESTHSSGLGGSCAFPSPVTAGDYIIVGANGWSSGDTISDTVGTPYTLVASSTTTATAQGYLWEGIVPSSGSDTVTLTASSGYYVAGCYEFSIGGSLSWATSSASGSTTSSTYTMASSTITPPAGTFVWSLSAMKDGGGSSSCTGGGPSTVSTASADFTFGDNAHGETNYTYCSYIDDYNQYSTSWPSSTSTTSSVSVTCSSCSEWHYWEMLMAVFTVTPPVTVPFQATLNTANGGSTQSITVNGCNPSPSTFTGSGTVDVIMKANCAYTLSPPDEYVITSGGSGTTCSTGTCTTQSVSYEGLATPSYVGGSGGTPSSTLACSLPFNIPYNSLIIVFDGQWSYAPPTGASDTIGNTFVNGPAYGVSGNGYVSTFYTISTASSSDQISLTFPSSIYGSVACAVFAPPVSGQPYILDTYSTGTSSSTTSLSVTSYTPTTGDLVVAGGYVYGGTVTSAGAGYTAGYLASNAGYGGTGDEYLIGSSGSTTSPMTTSAGGYQYEVSLAFKPATMVTQPFQADFNTLFGGSQQTVNVSGQCGPIPSNSFAGNGNINDLKLIAGCSFSLHLPSGYIFTGSSAGTACTSATCSMFATSYEHNPIIQSGSAAPSSSTAESATVTLNSVSQGDKILVVEFTSYGQDYLSRPSDTLGSAFQVANPYLNQANGVLAMATFYATATTSGSDTVTCNWYAGSTNVCYVFQIFSGLNVNAAYMTGGGEVASVSVASFTPNTSNLVIAMAGYNDVSSGTTLSPGSGYTALSTVSDSTNTAYLLGGEYQLFSSATATTAPMTLSAAAYVMEQVVEFSTSAPSPPPQTPVSAVSVSASTSLHIGSGVIGRVFYVNGLYWAFFTDAPSSSSYAYSSSSNGETWSAPVTFSTSGVVSAACISFAVFGINVYRASTNCTSAGDVTVNIFYDVGTMNPDGTITWGTEVEISPQYYANYPTVSIAVNSYGNPWIFYPYSNKASSGTIYYSVLTSTNAVTFVPNEPTTTTTADFYGAPYAVLVPLTAGKIALVGLCSNLSTYITYLCATEWGGPTNNSWSAPATAPVQYDDIINFGGVTALGDTLEVAGVSNYGSYVNNLYYFSLPYGGTWSAPKQLATVSSLTTLGSVASITGDGSSTLLVAYDNTAGAFAYMYSSNSGSTWSLPISLSSKEPIPVNYGTMAMTTMTNNEAGVMWEDGGPTIRFVDLYGPVSQPVSVSVADGAPSTSVGVTGCGLSTTFSTGSVTNIAPAGGCSYSLYNVASNYLIPITIDNTQGSPTPSGFQQLVSFDPAAYAQYLAPNLGNIRFYNSTVLTAANELYAWNENGTSNLQSNVAFWVKIPTSIPAGSSINIYMVLEPTTTQYDGVYWGESPALSATYGQYDNGANVFAFYNNFAGTSLNTNLWTLTTGTVTVDNGLTILGSSASTQITSVPTFSNGVLEWYGSMSEPSVTGYWPANGWAGSGGANIWMALGGNTNYQFGKAIAGGSAWTASTVTDGTYKIFGIWNDGTTSHYYMNQVLEATTYPQMSTSNNVQFQNGASSSGGGSTLSVTWVRVRLSPPSGVMPTVTFGGISVAGNAWYVFSGLGTNGTAMVTNTSCYQGTCQQANLVDYYEAQNVWQGTAMAQATFDSGLKAVLTGEQAGTAGQIVCTMTTTSSGIVQCIGVSDYNTPVTIPASFTGSPAGIRWENAANGPSTITPTTGGNTEKTDFYKQGYGTFEDIPKFGSWDSGLTGGQPTGAYLGSSKQLCTITLSGSSAVTCQGWGDWNSVGTMGTIAGAPANIRWLQYGSNSGTITSEGFTITSTFARQTYNTFSVAPVTPGTFSPNIVFSVFIPYTGAESTCVITVPASPAAGPYSAGCWSDSGQSFTFPKGATNNPYGTTWLAVSGQTMTRSTTTGGNTFQTQYSASTFGTQCPDPPAALAATQYVGASPIITLIQWVGILGAGLVMFAARRNNRRVGVTTFLEVFILIAAVLAGSGITYLAVNRYEQSLNKPSITMSSAALQQGAEFAMESMQLSDTGTSPFSSLTFSTPNLVTTSSTNWYITVVNAATGQPVIYNNEVAYTCSVTSAILTISFTSQYNLNPGNSVIVTIAISGTSVVVPGSNYNVLVGTSNGAQADEVVVASSNLVE